MISDFEAALVSQLGTAERLLRKYGNHRTDCHCFICRTLPPEDKEMLHKILREGEHKERAEHLNELSWADSLVKEGDQPAKIEICEREMHVIDVWVDKMGWLRPMNGYVAVPVSDVKGPVAQSG